MNLRRLVPTLLVLAATAVPAAAAMAEDNKVTAVNETDGAQIFQLSIDLRRITEGPVIDQNIAQVYSSCEDCRTIAIAVQVLLLMEDIRQVVPVNLAESINYECTRCESLAYAGQLVLSTGGKVRLTGEARKRIAEIEDALNALSSSDATLFEIYAEIDRLVDDLKQTVVSGLVPVGNKRDRQQAGEPAGGSDADTATGADAAAGGETPADGEQLTVAGDGAGDALPEELAGDGGDPAPDPTGSTPTAPEEPSPTTATGDPAPTPGVTTQTTTSAEPAPADSTTTAPPPAETTSTVGSPAPTTTTETTTTTSEPAPSTTTTTTTEPAPSETTATTEEPTVP